MKSQSNLLPDFIDDFKDLITIVEGVKDKKALDYFGFTNVIVLSKALYYEVERIPKGSRVQILTDFDAEGKKLYSKLKSSLSQRGVFVDDNLRLSLSKLKISHIEGLVSYARNRQII